MSNIQGRLGLSKESKKRIKLMQFGDPVTNICAGDRNPMLHCYFVQGRNDNVRCTDKKGSFWDICIDVIYPGHLNKNKRDELFDPVWQVEFGD